MQLLLLSLIWANILLAINGKQIKIECPSYCDCDIFLNFRRATCVNKTLVVIHLDLPIQTQILDISYNQISQLDDYDFSKNNLVELKFLNISHNKLSQVNVYAFDRLRELITLDLSYNAMQYILPKWFECMPKLEHLFLRGNYFGDMSYLLKYSFNSKSLKTLDLSKSYISYLKSDVFKLPNLEYLDLSENQLISLSQKIINPLRSLKVLKINGNSFSCNPDLTALKKLVLRKRIEFEDPCSWEKAPKKFEKLMQETTTQVSFERKYWMIEEDQDSSSKNVSIQQTICESDEKKRNLFIELSEFPYALLLVVILCYGILIGFICGCGMKYCRMRHNVRKYRNRKNIVLKNINKFDDEMNQLTTHINSLGNSTPIFTRR
ncbi:hypothetical protein HHI36_023114 [Cryptolaemus montrouzieri]|uniref:Uncharacterized protein n=1 Tax=Cryptolaemus montrouzieri TaxID=559131 RepID=A0ABD2PFC7_9CUCU